MIPDTPLQLITTGETPGDHVKVALAALDGGCKWIQLRMKGGLSSMLEITAQVLLPVVHERQAVLIINDNVDVAAKVGADGVHLGKDDMNPAKARKILGSNAIIGATAHNFEEALDGVMSGADYLGIGPYRFTSTKSNLAPRLGERGLRNLVIKLRRNSILLPVMAVGGITVDDIPVLRTCGVDRVAVAGAIANADDAAYATKCFLTQLNA